MCWWCVLWCRVLCAGAVCCVLVLCAGVFTLLSCVSHAHTHVLQRRVGGLCPQAAADAFFLSGKGDSVSVCAHTVCACVCVAAGSSSCVRLCTDLLVLEEACSTRLCDHGVVPSADRIGRFCGMTVAVVLLVFLPPPASSPPNLLLRPARSTPSACARARQPGCACLSEAVFLAASTAAAAAHRPHQGLCASVWLSVCVAGRRMGCMHSHPAKAWTQKGLSTRTRACERVCVSSLDVPAGWQPSLPSLRCHKGVSVSVCDSAGRRGHVHDLCCCCCFLQVD